MQKLISADIPMVQNSQSYNSKTQVHHQHCTLFPGQKVALVLYHPPLNAYLPLLRKRREGGASEIVLDSKMCWVQKMPCIYQAVGVWL